ncbi:MAG TPA: type II toxin-antitoxin system VapC family toxin [Geminicoccaceae bacterium]
MRRIVADTSAILAVLLSEPDEARFREALRESEVLLSTASRVELGLAARGRAGPGGPSRATRLLAAYAVRLVPVDERQTEIALDAMDRYGKGRGAPPAVLNYGDLFSYALAKAQDLPLLFKGNDFSATDITPALS